MEDVADLWRLHLSLDSIDDRPAFSAPRRTRGADELSTCPPRRLSKEQQQGVEAAAHVREHPLARRSISTRRPHKRPADARRSIDEMTSLPTSTSSAARRRPRQKPRTMPLDTSLKFTVPSTKPRAGTALLRAASSAKTRSAAACGADESPQGGTLHGSER